MEPIRSPPFAARHSPVASRTGLQLTNTGIVRSKLMESVTPRNTDDAIDLTTARIPASCLVDFCFLGSVFMFFVTGNNEHTL